MSWSRVKGLFLSVAILAAALPVSGSAQEGEVAQDQLAALRECRTIAGDSSRLACFDAAAAEVISQADTGEFSIVDKEDIRSTRRGLFGFSLPKLGVFGAGDDEDIDTTMQSRITGVRQLRSDQWEIEIEEGSVWLANNTPRRFKPRVGADIELEKAALSSFWLRVDGQLGVKASRVR